MYVFVLSLPWQEVDRFSSVNGARKRCWVFLYVCEASPEPGQHCARTAHERTQVSVINMSRNHTRKHTIRRHDMTRHGTAPHGTARHRTTKCLTVGSWVPLLSKVLRCPPGGRSLRMRCQCLCIEVHVPRPRASHQPASAPSQGRWDCMARLIHRNQSYRHKTHTNQNASALTKQPSAQRKGVILPPSVVGVSCSTWRWLGRLHQRRNHR